MKLEEYLKINNIKPIEFARSITSPDITRHTLHYRIKNGWAIEEKKGGVVMQSPFGHVFAHQWVKNARKNRK